MAIDAALAIISHIKTVLTNYGLTTTPLDFFPGPFAAPKNQKFPWATYRLVPNLDYGQPYISTDAMQIELNHTGYDQLQQMLSVILKKLNSENPQDNIALYNLCISNKVKLHDVVARVHRVLPNDFIEGTDYFTATVDILVQYVTLPSTGNGNKTAYIEGV